MPYRAPKIFYGQRLLDMSDVSQGLWVDDILWVLKDIQGNRQGENAIDSNRVICLSRLEEPSLDFQLLIAIWTSAFPVQFILEHGGPHERDNPSSPRLCYISDSSRALLPARTARTSSRLFRANS
jgi:hypothetical protein